MRQAISTLCTRPQLLTGEYTADACPNCGRHRLMKCQDDKIHCEKCLWCVEDKEYQSEYKEN